MSREDAYNEVKVVYVTPQATDVLEHMVAHVLVAKQSQELKMVVVGKL